VTRRRPQFLQRSDIIKAVKAVGKQFHRHAHHAHDRYLPVTLLPLDQRGLFSRVLLMAKHEIKEYLTQIYKLPVTKSIR
jgi:hypothetical protein